MCINNNNKFIPLTAIIEVTLACNLKCIHCGSSAGIKRDDEMSFDEIIKVCKDLKSLGCKGISLMGGEVLLRKDWNKIVQHIVESGMNCAIITNGYLISEKIIKEIKNLGIVQTGISLDGATPKTQGKIRGLKDSYYRAFNAIRLSLEYDLPLTSVITTVSKININELEFIFQLLLNFDQYIDWQIKIASNHNCDRFAHSEVIDKADYLKIAEFISHNKYRIAQNNLNISLSEAHDLGYFSEKFPNLSNNWKGCIAGIKTIGIQSNGNIKGCLALSDEFIEGNVRNEGLVEIWKNPQKFKHTRQFKASNLEGECKECNKNNICRGGCHDFAFSMTGSVYNTPFCLYQ